MSHENSSEVAKFTRNVILGGASAATVNLIFNISERFSFKVKLIKQMSEQAGTQGNIIQHIINATKGITTTNLLEGHSKLLKRYAQTHALNFAFNDTYRGLFNTFNPDTQFWKFFLANLASGGAAGATTLLLVYPLDFPRVRLAVDAQHRNSIGFVRWVECLYKGFGISAIGMTIYRSAYFGLYDTLKTAFRLEDQNIISKLAVAYCALSSAVFLSNPSDAVRKNLLQQGIGGNHSNRAILYGDAADCFEQLMKKKGPKALFKGASARIARGWSNAVVLVLYDELQTLFARSRSKLVH